jgi:hypothetical protein
MNAFKMIHHVDRRTLEWMYRRYEPVFILSTGRSGSKLIVELLGLSPAVNAFHEPRPTLQVFSDFAYHHQAQDNSLTKMIDAARMEMVLETLIKGKVFVESNQCLTFFAPAIAALFRSAKFIHLVRHPGDFLASAARKGWYMNDSIWEAGRPTSAETGLWRKWDQMQKLAWLWAATNAYVEDFKKNLGKRRVLTIRLEDLVLGREGVKSVFAFSGAGRVPWAEVERIQKTRINELQIFPDEPPNMRKNPDFPAYGEWPDAQKRWFRERVGTLAALYGYEI